MLYCETQAVENNLQQLCDTHHCPVLGQHFEIARPARVDQLPKGPSKNYMSNQNLISLAIRTLRPSQLTPEDLAKIEDIVPGSAARFVNSYLRDATVRRCSIILRWLFIAFLAYLKAT